MEKEKNVVASETNSRVTAEIVKAIICESTQSGGFSFTAYYPQMQMQVTCVLKEDWLISHVTVDHSSKKPEISFIGKKDGQSAVKFAVRGKEFVAAAERWFVNEQKTKQTKKDKCPGTAMPPSIVFNAGVTELL